MKNPGFGRGSFFGTGAARFCDIDAIFTPVVAPSIEGAPRRCAIVRNNRATEETSFDGRQIFSVVSPLRFDGDENLIVVSQQSNGTEEHFLGVEENNCAIEENVFVIAHKNGAGAPFWFDLSQMYGAIVARSSRGIAWRFYC